MGRFVRYSLLALAMVAVSTAAQAQLEFSGYGRAGIGWDFKGGRQICFNHPGSDMNHFRLGNECDYVIEPDFQAKFVKLEDKSQWGVNFMPKVYRSWGNTPVWRNATTDTAAGAEDPLMLFAQQFYFFGENLPWLGNGRVWGGRRYYDRVQTNINDQFLENEDGNGAGLENIEVGFGKLSLAVLEDPNGNVGDTSRSTNSTMISVHMTDIQTFAGSNLALYGAARLYSNATENVGGQETDFRLAAYHNSPLLGGNLLLGAKYNRNGHAKENRFRVVAQWGGNLAAAKTDLDLFGEFRIVSNDTQESGNEFMIGFRTTTNISGPFYFLVEIGDDNVLPQVAKGASAERQNLLKATGALQIATPGGAPHFRLFVTYATWNDQLKTQVGGPVYTNDTSGVSAGVQAEGWW